MRARSRFYNEKEKFDFLYDFWYTIYRKNKGDRRMKVITYEDVKEINRLYLELGTYAAVARKTGFAPSTVKKYVKSDFVPIEQKNIKKFEGPLPEFDSSIFRAEDWHDLCSLSEEEIEGITQLWEELEL